MHKLLRAARQSGGTTRQAGTDVSMTANGCRVAGPRRLSKLWVAAASLLILTLLDVASGHLIESETMSTCPADGSGGETCQARAGDQDSGTCAHCSGHGNCDPTQTFSPCVRSRMARQQLLDRRMPKELQRAWSLRHYFWKLQLRPWLGGSFMCHQTMPGKLYRRPG